MSARSPSPPPAGPWPRSGRDAVGAHERALVGRLTGGLAAIDGVRTFRLWPADGESAEPDRIGVVTFTVDGYPAALVAQYLSAEHGIGVRDGRFCAHPLLARFAADGVTADGAGVRASLGLGSRAEDVDRLLAALASLRAHGPAWTYAAPEAGLRPGPDPRALPGWLARRRRRPGGASGAPPDNTGAGRALARPAPRSPAQYRPYCCCQR